MYILFINYFYKKHIIVFMRIEEDNLRARVEGKY